jgi:hypothetical protein
MVVFCGFALQYLERMSPEYFINNLDRLPCICPSIHPWLYNPLSDLGRFSVSWSFTQSVGLLGRESSPSQERYLRTGQNKRTQTSMPWVGFEPTIPVFERAKTVHVWDRTAILIGNLCTYRNHETVMLLFPPLRRAAEIKCETFIARLKHLPGCVLSEWHISLLHHYTVCVQHTMGNKTAITEVSNKGNFSFFGQIISGGPASSPKKC